MCSLISGKVDENKNNKDSLEPEQISCYSNYTQWGMWTPAVIFQMLLAVFRELHLRWVQIDPCISIANTCDVFSLFVEFYGQSGRQTGNNLKSIHSYNGGEYINIKFIQYLNQRGIFVKRSCAHTPQNNLMSELISQTLPNKVWTLLKQKSIPKEFWADSLMTAVFIRNRTTWKGFT